VKTQKAFRPSKPGECILYYTHEGHNLQYIGGLDGLSCYVLKSPPNLTHGWTQPMSISGPPLPV